MNKDQIKGRLETAKGDLKETAGKVVGSEKLRAAGQADQAEGKARSAAGDIRAKAASAAKDAVDR